MGIDGIGKVGGPGPIAPPTAGGIDHASGPEEFSLQRTEKALDVEAASPLDQLRAGEIDVDGYLDARVEQATSHLVDRLDQEKLAFIRSSLRTQLEQDPALIELVKRATGAAGAAFERG